MVVEGDWLKWQWSEFSRAIEIANREAGLCYPVVPCVAGLGIMNHVRDIAGRLI